MRGDCRLTEHGEGAMESSDINRRVAEAIGDESVDAILDKLECAHFLPATDLSTAWAAAEKLCHSITPDNGDWNVSVESSLRGAVAFIRIRDSRGEPMPGLIKGEGHTPAIALCNAILGS